MSHDRDNWWASDFVSWIITSEQSFIFPSMRSVIFESVEWAFYLDIKSFRNEETGIKIYLRINIDDDTIFASSLMIRSQRDTNLSENSLTVRKSTISTSWPDRSTRVCLISSIFFLVFHRRYSFDVEKYRGLLFGCQKCELMFWALFSWFEIFLRSIRFTKFSFILSPQVSENCYSKDSWSTSSKTTWRWWVNQNY